MPHFEQGFWGQALLPQLSRPPRSPTFTPNSIHRCNASIFAACLGGRCKAVTDLSAHSAVARRLADAPSMLALCIETQRISSATAEMVRRTALIPESARFGEADQAGCTRRPRLRPDHRLAGPRTNESKQHADPALFRKLISAIGAPSRWPASSAPIRGISTPMRSGLGLGLGLVVLALLFAATYWAEAPDGTAHEVYYWLAIIIIRTGATNIADYLAFRVRVPPLLLTSGLAALIAVLAWAGSAPRARNDLGAAPPPLGKTNLAYWAAMLSAGVFRHRLRRYLLAPFRPGDRPRSAWGCCSRFCSPWRMPGSQPGWRPTGARSHSPERRAPASVIGLPRTKSCMSALPLSTLLTGAAFITLLTIWRSAPPETRAAA